MENACDFHFLDPARKAIAEMMATNANIIGSPWTVPNVVDLYETNDSEE
jgi:hypothetical protein